jgi:hypothetical protein
MICNTFVDDYPTMCIAWNCQRGPRLTWWNSMIVKGLNPLNWFFLFHGSVVWFETLEILIFGGKKAQSSLRWFQKTSTKFTKHHLEYVGWFHNLVWNLVGLASPSPPSPCKCSSSELSGIIAILIGAGGLLYIPTKMVYNHIYNIYISIQFFLPQSCTLSNLRSCPPVPLHRLARCLQPLGDWLIGGRTSSPGNMVETL